MHTSIYGERFGKHNLRSKRDRKVRRTVTMPERVGPLAKLVFAEMARLGVSYDEVEVGSGVKRASVKAWRRKNRPGLENLQAVFGFLGWDFVPVPSLRVLPLDVASDVTALALRLESDLPATWATVVAAGVEQALLNMSIEERHAVMSARSGGQDCCR